jgi:hypothetical protein
MHIDLAGAATEPARRRDWGYPALAAAVKRRTGLQGKHGGIGQRNRLIFE